ncbi:hypothetical protein L5515_019581 [Caenorhabditis briggsae]|uniref:Uncharacterized protein n=1 Tax=Caenorhabditis briggsae TaxID=6238 RepID=A0AAE9FJP1_CAEBR|nr:hypothetical protein L5515_019581 [Caenorhabditis briggsae]
MDDDLEIEAYRQGDHEPENVPHFPMIPDHMRFDTDKILRDTILQPNFIEIFKTLFLRDARGFSYLQIQSGTDKNKSLFVRISSLSRKLEEGNFKR